MGLVERLKETIITWKAIVTHPRFIEGFKISFNKPVYLAFFLILLSYAIGYFKFHVLWCIIVLIMANSLANLMLKRHLRFNINLDRLKREADRQPGFESADWLNNILAAVYRNHHKYISHLFVRFAEPLLNRCCAPPPIDHLSFDALDIGEQSPVLTNLIVHRVGPHEIKYDFDCDYHADFNGVVICKMVKRTIPTYISNLYWKAKMRFSVVFVQDRFPFIARLRMQLLDKPTVDISVKCEGLPDMMEMPVITEYFIKLVREQMCAECLYPNYLEAVLCDPDSINPETDLSEDEQKFMDGIITLTGKLIEHGIRSRLADQPKNKVDSSKFPTLGAIHKGTSFLKKMSTGKLSKSKMNKSGPEPLPKSSLSGNEDSKLAAGPSNPKIDELKEKGAGRRRSTSFPNMAALLKMAEQAGTPTTEESNPNSTESAAPPQSRDDLLEKSTDSNVGLLAPDAIPPRLKKSEKGGSFISRGFNRFSKMSIPKVPSYEDTSAPDKVDFLEAPSNSSLKQSIRSGPAESESVPVFASRTASPADLGMHSAFSSTSNSLYVPAASSISAASAASAASASNSNSFGSEKRSSSKRHKLKDKDSSREKKEKKEKKKKEKKMKSYDSGTM